MTQSRGINSHREDWCRELWCAVVRQALLDALVTGSYGWKEHDWMRLARAKEAERWLRDDPDGVVAWLGFDGGALLDRARVSNRRQRWVRGRA